MRLQSPPLTQITNWVDGIVNVQNLVVVESTHDVVHAIDSLDVTQEGISQARTLARPLDQARNIRNLQIRRVHTRWVPDLAEEVLSTHISSALEPNIM